MSENEILNELEVALQNNNIIYNRDYYKEIMAAIQGLLDLYQKEIEKNKEKFSRGYVQGRRDERDETDNKIKEKIEELDRELQLCEKQHIDTIKAYTPIDIIKAEIKRLQELLEERN